jgi:hypothetical protein
VQRTRNYCGVFICQELFPEPGGGTTELPSVWDEWQVAYGATYTRSFGRERKLNLTFGFGGYQRAYRAPEDLGLSEAQRAYLEENEFPRTEGAAYLSGTVRAFEARYAVLENILSFDLSEDWQLGYSGYVKLRWADPAWFSPQRFFETGAAARYRWNLQGDLLTVSVAGTARYQPEVTRAGIAGPFVNERLAMEVSNVSPPLGPGRIVNRVLLDVRQDDLNNSELRVGGTNYLRGAALSPQRGPNLLVLNTEYRTRALEWQTVHLGFVFFWDAGAAYVSRPRLVHTLGAGLRLLFPQFNVQVIRIDFGVVLNGPSPTLLDRFSSSFGQVPSLNDGFLENPL